MSMLSQLDEIFAKHPDIVLSNLDTPKHMMVKAQIVNLKRQGVDLKARYAHHRPKILKNLVVTIPIVDDLSTDTPKIINSAPAIEPVPIVPEVDNSDPGDEVPETSVDIVTKKTKRTSQKP